MTVKPKQLTLIGTNSAVKGYGKFSEAVGDSGKATGYASTVGCGANTAGQTINNFVITAGGTLVTIVGSDQRAQFDIGEPVRIVPTSPQALPARDGVILDVPAYAAGNTIFNLTAPIDAVTTNGEIVESCTVPIGRGQFAVAHGNNCIAEGGYSSAKGFACLAYGSGATAEGASCWAYGHAAHAEGEQCTAGGTDSHAEGIGNTAMGTAAHVEGTGSPGRWNGCVAGGDGSHAEGSFTRAGNDIHPFTIVPNGTLVTIPGNVVSEFSVGDTRIPFLPLLPQKGAILYGTIADQPVFAAGNTTFNLVDPLSVRTALDTYGVGLVCASGYTCGTKQGVGAHAEGQNTVASRSGSHAEGALTAAYGTRSHAEGSQTIARGDKSHAEGEFSVASGYGSHAEGGLTTLANASYSHAEGSGSRCGNLAQPFTIAAGGTVMTIVGNVTAQFVNGGALDIDSTTPTTTNRRITTITVASVPAFAAGNTTFSISAAIDAYTTGGNVVSPNIGIAAHAEGLNTTAIANYSHAEGQACIATGVGSHSEGGASTASGLYSHAEGASIASSSRAHSEGTGTASAADTHAEGQGTTASAVGAHAQGGLTVASGVYSHAEGISCQALAQATHASGEDARAGNPNEDCFAGTKFTVLGDAQYRRLVIKGLTPGSGAGETVVLKSGASAAVFMIANKSYMAKLRGIATKMGTGVAAKQTWAFELNFEVDSSPTNGLTISALTPVYTLVTGAAFVGATITAGSTGSGSLELTFAIAGGLTVQARVVGFIEFVEVLGS